ncbi:MAG: hypothetical protein HC786_10090, partial [Richelia sp. CSU_2_1]|nr:hypothetical protein [Richelia sp. CSU_2_1]
MRWSANIAVFRFGVALLSALSTPCLDANKAISQTVDISQLPAATADPTATGSIALTLQKPEINLDKNPIDLVAASDIANSQNTYSTIDEIDETVVAAPILPAANECANSQDAPAALDETIGAAPIWPASSQLTDSNEKSQNQPNSNFLAQNPPTAPRQSAQDRRFKSRISSYRRPPRNPIPTAIASCNQPRSHSRN